MVCLPHKKTGHGQRPLHHLNHQITQGTKLLRVHPTSGAHTPDVEDAHIAVDHGASGEVHHRSVACGMPELVDQ